MNAFRLLAIALTWAACSAHAQFPDRSITMIVPFPPGGVADAVARPVAEAMSRDLRQPVVIENKPGAGGGIGMAQAAKARPDDILFVFARAAEGPRMPLAILRKQVKDLPLTFTLDDSMAMSPAAKLSSTPRVVVGARISASGNATAQAGDLQGFSAPVAPGAAGLKIQIADVVATP